MLFLHTLSAGTKSDFVVIATTSLRSRVGGFVVPLTGTIRRRLRVGGYFEAVFSILLFSGNEADSNDWQSETAAVLVLMQGFG